MWLYAKLSFAILGTKDPRIQSSVWRRLVLFLFVWIVLIPWQGINRLALLLDHFIPFHRQPIRNPVFVTGVPRSGTTLLHRLLTEDQSQITTFRLWELLFAPAIVQKIPILVLAKLDRMLGRPLNWIFAKVERILFGGLEQIHGTGLKDPEEDYLALLPYGGCFLLIHVFPFAEDFWNLVDLRYREPVSSAALKDAAQPGPRAFELDELIGQTRSLDVEGFCGDQRTTRLIQTYIGLVQRHLYVFGRNGETFVSKNPAFTLWIPELAKALPSAKFLVCQREPGQAIPSLISSMESGARLTGNQNNLEFQKSLVDMMTRFYFFIALNLFDEQTVQVIDYRNLTSNPWGLLETLKVKMNLNSLDLHENLKKACLTATNYKSRHRYDSTQFGLEIGRIRLELDQRNDGMEPPQRSNLSEQRPPKETTND